MSSILNDQTSGNFHPLKSGRRSGDFLSDMLKALHISKNGSSQTTDTSTEINATTRNKGYKYYLESFKKDLLAQGKPLNKTILKEKDLSLLKTFLFQCGFSHEKVERFVKDLKSNNPNGEFNLSQIIFKISELKEPKGKERQNDTLSPAAVPYVESILRDFNLTPMELDKVFSKARVDGGGLDIAKLAEKLKEIKGRTPLENKTIVDQKFSRQISEKMEKIGMNIPEKGKADQINLNDFIASLEQITEKFGKEKKVSHDMKNTLDKILEQAEVSGQKSTSESSVKFSSNYHFTESLLKDEINKKGRYAFNEKKTSSVENSKSGKNESISSILKQKDVKVKNYVGPGTGTSGHSGKDDLISNLKKQTEIIIPAKEQGYALDKEAERLNVLRNTEAFSFTNTLKTVEHGEKPVRSYIPASLVDQVGRQISRSILRGDQLVTLQLKPPDLGTVRIKMDIKDHILRLSMTAEHHSVKELLLNNINELKEALVQHGVKLETVDVQINHNFGQSLNASKERTDNGRGWRKDFDGEEFHSDIHTEGLHERPINIMLESNLLNLVA